MGTNSYVPDTENRNPDTVRIDAVDTLEMLAMINDEDKKTALAVEKQLSNIARAVETAEGAIRNGGRVIYIGAGTSGRLGVLDASECPPTYSVPPDWFMGVIAGGRDALVRSSEGKEDHPELGVADLKSIHFCEKDFLVGLAASGRTPYVIGALTYAKELGAMTACVVCSRHSPMESASSIAIVLDTGPEAVTGSTRMKSGTAQKMVLNMLSTGTMIRLGKVYGNLMVDVSPTNSKLLTRAKGIICKVTGCSEETAETALKQSENSVKVAIVMLKKEFSPQAARALLEASGGKLKQALDEE